MNTPASLALAPVAVNNIAQSEGRFPDKDSETARLTRTHVGDYRCKNLTYAVYRAKDATGRPFVFSEPPFTMSDHTKEQIQAFVKNMRRGLKSK